MKKITAILLMALMVLSLTACGNQTGKDNNGSEGSTEPTSVTITTLNGQKEQTQLEVPYNPERIAILDLACLDIIDELGVVSVLVIKLLEWHRQALIIFLIIQKTRA